MILQIKCNLEIEFHCIFISTYNVTGASVRHSILQDILNGNISFLFFILFSLHMYPQQLIYSPTERSRYVIIGLPMDMGGSEMVGCNCISQAKFQET